MEKELLHCVRKADRKGYSLHGRLWIEGKNGAFLGYGKILLLERIRQYGSISQAAKSMKMSYHHAWNLVDSMNKQAAKPLVEKVTGGKGGGGARLTEAGERAVKIFRDLDDRFNKFLAQEIKSFVL